MLFSQAYLLPLLTNMLPGPNTSKVTTLWHYTHLCIIIIITIITDPNHAHLGDSQASQGYYC